MPLVKLNLVSNDVVGTVGQHYGYKSEVKENREIWAEVQDNMLELEIACGRVDAKSVPVVDTKPPKTDKPPKPPKSIVPVVDVTPTTVAPVSDAVTTDASAPTAE